MTRKNGDILVKEWEYYYQALYQQEQLEHQGHNASTQESTGKMSKSKGDLLY